MAVSTFLPNLTRDVVVNPCNLSALITCFTLYSNSKQVISYSIIFFLAQLVPSWNVTITYKTSSSLTVQWSKFPLTNLTIQRFLVNYREHNSNVSLIFQTPSSYITHYSGSVLKSYQFYDVEVIAVTASGDNGTYSSRTESARTDEGGNIKRTVRKITK